MFKKIIFLIWLVLIISGCQNQEFDYTCLKNEKHPGYKYHEELSFSLDQGSVYKLVSEIKETHQTETTLCPAYYAYQNKYDNYNKNNVYAEYQKENLTIKAKYILDKADIDHLKIKLPYQVKLPVDMLLKSLTKAGYKCQKN